MEGEGRRWELGGGGSDGNGGGGLLVLKKGDITKGVT